MTAEVRESTRRLLERLLDVIHLDAAQAKQVIDSNDPEDEYARELLGELHEAVERFEQALDDLLDERERSR